MVPEGPSIFDALAGEMILNTPTINTSIVKSEEQCKIAYPCSRREGRRSDDSPLTLGDSSRRCLPRSIIKRNNYKCTSRNKKKTMQGMGERYLPLRTTPVDL